MYKNDSLGYYRYYIFPAGVAQELQVLNNYVVMGKVENASKENSWKYFHQNVNKFTVKGFSAPDAAFLATLVFEQMLNRLWKSGEDAVHTSASEPITDDDCDIIAYIAGSNLKQLLQKYQSCDEGIILTMLICNKDDAHASNIKLTALKDRGGLTYITKNAFELYKHMETIFRTTSESKKNMLRDDFTVAAVAATGNKMYDIVKEHENYDEVMTESMIYAVLSDVIDKYFSTRIHHRCRIMTENLQQQRKSKRGLRQSLKKS